MNLGLRAWVWVWGLRFRAWVWGLHAQGLGFRD